MKVKNLDAGFLFFFGIQKHQEDDLFFSVNQYARDVILQGYSPINLISVKYLLYDDLYTGPLARTESYQPAISR